jgi:hypothetical protein
LSWANGGNVRIEQRWTNADINRARPLAKELVQLQPNVILDFCNKIARSVSAAMSAL